MIPGSETPNPAPEQDGALHTLHAEGEGLQAHPLDGLLEPGARNFSVEASIAISLKRLADALAGKSDGSTCSLLELIADRMQGPYSS